MKRTLATDPIPHEGRLLRLVKVQRLKVSQARVAAEIARDAEQPLPSVSQTAAGDSRRMRGVPIQAPGVGSTAPGTDPLSVLLAKERRMERD